MNYKIVNNITGWIVFVIAAITYMTTAESSASLWDCGEFIAASDKLQVVHPPGAPLFLMMGRMFALMAPSQEMIPVFLNYFSALSTAFAVLFLFWIITALARKLILKNGAEPDTSQLIAIMGAGAVGALAATFSDTMWFSAVEGEVYALSTFFIAIVLWGMMKWEANADKPGGDRWLIFMAFMIGLSIGVHLLSLLVIPITVLVYYFKRFKVTLWGSAVALIAGMVILQLVQTGVIQFLTARAANNELFLINTVGLPFNMGILIYYIFVFVFVGGLIYLSQVKKPNALHLAIPVGALAVMVSPNVLIGLIAAAILTAGLWMFFQGGKYNLETRITGKMRQHFERIGLALLFILIGFSTYVMIPIRSAADTPINMNAPKDAFSLLSYLNREQYGDRPLLFGPLHNAPAIDYLDKGTKYYPDKESGKYKEKGKKTGYKYNREDKVFFPRLYSNDPSHVAMYKQWINEDYDEPTQRHNFAYFFKYQIGYMYMRYFMWNFAGRQDDFQGLVSNKNYHGNWLSGIPFFDNARLQGDQSELPEVMKEHKARNYYYLLPLIFGLIGLAFLLFRNERWAFVFFFLFILTGVMLIVYFNSPPREPRERDYTLVGSFYTYCVFIGLAVLAIYEGLKKFIPGTVSASVATLVGLIAVPYVMATAGYDDHNRKDRRMARDFAVNFLESCPKDAILFTQGDNDTYPLWYAQEVEGIRPDVRVANLSLIGVDWYIDFLRKAANDNQPLPFYSEFVPDNYRGDKNNQVFYKQKTDANEHLELSRVLKFVFDDSRQELFLGRKYNYFPTNKVKITVDTTNAAEKWNIPAKYQDKIINEMEITIPFTGRANSKYIVKNDLAIVALVAAMNTERPICFANTVSPSSYNGLEKFLMQEGLMYRLVPVEFKDNAAKAGQMAMHTDAMHQRIMDNYRYGGLDEKEHFIDENTHRLMHGLRNVHLSLAKNLQKEGKSEKSVEILERMREKFPNMNCKYYSPYNTLFPGSLYSYNNTTVDWIELYYQNGKPEIAKEMYDVMMPQLIDAWDFYENSTSRFSDNFRGSWEDRNFRHREKAMYNIQRLSQIAKKHNDNGFYDQLAENFPSLVKAREKELINLNDPEGNN